MHCSCLWVHLKRELSKHFFLCVVCDMNLHYISVSEADDKLLLKKLLRPPQILKLSDCSIHPRQCLLKVIISCTGSVLACSFVPSLGFTACGVKLWQRGKRAGCWQAGAPFPIHSESDGPNPAQVYSSFYRFVNISTDFCPIPYFLLSSKLL